MEVSNNPYRVEISIYAVPLFRDGTSVRYAYIPVHHGPERPARQSRPAEESEPSTISNNYAHESLSASAMMSAMEASGKAAIHPTIQVGHTGQQSLITSSSTTMKTVPRPSSLIGSMHNHAQSTWDSWGRLKKGTWLRWLHDIGQTATEDVSAEARLARGIPSKATKARSLSELWRFIGAVALMPVGFLLDHSILVALPAPLGTGYSSYKAYIHYKGVRGSWRLQQMIRTYQAAGLERVERSNSSGSRPDEPGPDDLKPSGSRPDEPGPDDLKPSGSRTATGAEKDGQQNPVTEQGAISIEPYEEHASTCRGGDASPSTGGWGHHATPSPSSGGWGHHATPSPSSGGWGHHATPSPSSGGWGHHATPSPSSGGLGHHATPSPSSGDWGHHATPSPSSGGLGHHATPSPSSGGWGHHATPSPSSGGWGHHATPSPSSASASAVCASASSLIRTPDENVRGDITSYGCGVRSVSGRVTASEEGMSCEQEKIKDHDLLNSGLEYKAIPALNHFVSLLIDSSECDVLSEEDTERLCSHLPEEHRAEVTRHVAELRRRHVRLVARDSLRRKQRHAQVKEQEMTGKTTMQQTSVKGLDKCEEPGRQGQGVSALVGMPQYQEEEGTWIHVSSPLSDHADIAVQGDVQSLDGRSCGAPAEPSSLLHHEVVPDLKDPPSCR
ncbi:hypothetical protein CEUSTIGMA_g9005.t1 [Chlamydomonas eustigma]|uniref:Uncharacterized protein n=1 Tax=Chlamydomonas eustigma TaxID=1157962 RepID=A0A250XET0_9CHLO|nr:hypothetical protein CEUSTIGMA_g9005.t1 [Chlamydomonas eustigma]|eukprot:GAX81577.1 hypothetical protein CEUSTIGMA_g9005.t1 [Chlamydomonas eustigma]